MPVTSQLRTPGVYVTEEDAFPPSIVGVPTALPAFIGYTEKANIAGKPIFGKPQKISSFAEFTAIFGGAFEPVIDVDEVTGVKVQSDADAYDVSFTDPNTGGSKYYKLQQSSSSQFNLYASMKLFYDNGGEQCYVLSVGNYTDSGATKEGVPISASALTDGLTAVGEIVGPTILVIPDAVLIEPSSSADPYKSTEFYDLVKAMMKQCGDLQDRVAVLDVYGANLITKENLGTELDLVIDEFRNNTGTENLSYGMTYFPFLNTSVMAADEVTYKYFEYSGLKKALDAEAAMLYSGTSKKKAVDDMIALANPTDPDTPTKDEEIAALNGNLTSALPMLKQMEQQVGLQLGVLPPSAAMAGVMAEVDADKGVWNAPANISLNSVISPTIDINNELQADLNVPLGGKAIDVIRTFPGRGTVPWGARTLLGNSDDWRYIQVRRTMIYIEQSIKNAMMPFVFAANDGKTWSTVVSAVSNFLQRTWSQGGLMGNTPDKAFTVECGLGSTMTAQDILEGYMNVEVRVAMLRPAEFIVLNFKQKMLEA